MDVILLAGDLAELAAELALATRRLASFALLYFCWASS